MAKQYNKNPEPIEEKPTEEESVITNEETTPEIKEEVTVADEAPVVKEYTPEVKYREVVYLGIADVCERIGAVTGNRYSFTKDTYGMPKETYVDERDYPAIISERGRGCARRDPALVFMSKLEWD